MNTRHVIVQNVIQENDCAGRKCILIDVTGADETVKTYFRLTPDYRLPHDKLRLACVEAGDTVCVTVEDYDIGYSVSGVFTDIISDTSHREPKCVCDSPIVTDGYTLHCVNRDCGLTAAARLRRLAQTRFFPTDYVVEEDFAHPEPLPLPHEVLVNYPYEMLDSYQPVEIDEKLSMRMGYFNHHGITLSDRDTMSQPFQFITEASFWGAPFQSLEHVLLKQSHGYISNATFLVESLFIDLLDTIQLPDGYLNNCMTQYAFLVFRDMQEMVSRRNIESDRQDYLIRAFLHGLAIESLTDEHIGLLMAYEKESHFVSDTLLTYAYALTHPQTLVHEVGIHMFEAEAIHREVRSRVEEFNDIFMHYALNYDDMMQCFKRLI